MTDDTIHTCSYECERPGCIRAQRDYLAARLTASQQQEQASRPSAPVGVDFAAVASILRRAMRDGVHYGYRRDFILQQALALEALAQQPAAQRQRQAVALPKLKRTHPDYSREEVQWVFGYNAALDDVMRLNKNTASAAQQQEGRDHG